MYVEIDTLKVASVSTRETLPFHTYSFFCLRITIFKLSSTFMMSYTRLLSTSRTIQLFWIKLFKTGLLQHYSSVLIYRNSIFEIISSLWIRKKIRKF